MKEDNVKRQEYWIVEATDRSGKSVFRGEFKDFNSAWEKYYSFKGRFGALLQRKFREYNVA